MIAVFRKTVILFVGCSLLIIGAALIVLPGPAFIVIPLALALLAVEFSWARRWLASLRKKISRTGRSRRHAGLSRFQ